MYSGIDHAREWHGNSTAFLIDVSSFDLNSAGSRQRGTEFACGGAIQKKLQQRRRRGS
jgi:hypothetical protein